MNPYDLTLGPILVGTILNVMFFGIMIVQCFVYYLNYKTDKNHIKIIVVVLFLLDTISCLFDIEMAYNYLITDFGNNVAIGLLNVGISPYPVLTGLTAFIVQGFFSWRVLVLTKSRIVAGVITTLSCVQFLASIGTTIGGVVIGQLAELYKVEVVALLWLFSSVATDLLITIALVWYLSTHRTGIAETDDIISRLIRMTVQTGLITTVCASGVAISYLSSNSSLHLGWGLPLSKLYTNSLLSTLNMRKGWATGDFSRGGTIPGSSRRPYNAPGLTTPIKMSSFSPNASAASANASTHVRDDDSELGMNNDTKVTL